MANVKLENIVKDYEDGYRAVKNINLDIEDKEFIVLVGPSGCGKSTTLRMIAGLENPSSGEIKIEDDVVNDMSPKDRDIAMVFQSYALYPHMTVRENISFPLKMRKVSKDKIRSKVSNIAGVLQLEELLDKKPAQLSGGQRQRVALGRAMVRKPKVFLLNEPLSNLDAKLRVEMRSEIVNLHKKLNTTFIYVTHDQTEAMTMGDRIAVLNKGVLEQFDTPLNLYYKPNNRFVAEFIGTPKMNIFETEFSKNDDKLFIKLFGKILQIPSELKDKFSSLEMGKSYYVGIRSEDFFIDDNSQIDLLFSNVEYMGSDIYAYAEADESNDRIIMRFDAEENIDKNLRTRVGIDFKKLFVFRKDREKTVIFPTR